MNFSLGVVALSIVAALIIGICVKMDVLQPLIDKDLARMKNLLRNPRRIKAWFIAQFAESGRHHRGTGKHSGFTLAQLGISTDSIIQRRREPVRGIRFAKVVTA